MGKLKIFGFSVGAFIAMIVLIFCLGLLGLGYYKFFGPKKENIRREIFEQTQSYVHGKIQDLAKYKEEYDKAESISDKDAVAAIIKVRFAEFDESKIKAINLRNFLTATRGY